MPENEEEPGLRYEEIERFRWEKDESSGEQKFTRQVTGTRRDTIISYDKETQEDLEKEINQYLKEQFPKTFESPKRCCRAALEVGKYTEEEIRKKYISYLDSHIEYLDSKEEEKRYEKIRQELEVPGTEIWDVEIIDAFGRNQFPYFHNKERGEELLYLGTLLGDEGIIEPGNAVSQIRENLEGKKILSLGDDTGSFTEILEHFGCETTGIEYDEDKVEAARTGILSEDGRKRQNVIQGDVWDLMIPESDLSKRIDNDYDAIFSNALFNIGSGIQNYSDQTENQLYESIAEDRRRNFKIDMSDRQGLDPESVAPIFFIDTSDTYLNEEGINLHLSVDMCISWGALRNYGFLSTIGSGVSLNIAYSPSFEAFPEKED